ncbi:hypothetical protein Dxin01_00142 [Deinococcus xinjiangensis]|uniref:Uncharacterized protein n=1 Tax=Deinococcus xinjiangensis TaxID=457454 RepID=A0ABP9V712_9DEIO
MTEQANLQLYQNDSPIVPYVGQQQAAYLEVVFKSGYRQIVVTTDEMVEENINSFDQKEHLFIPVPLHPLYTGQADELFVVGMIPSDLVQELQRHDELPARYELGTSAR